MTSKPEVWRAHPDIPGVQVSTLGRVRTLDRIVPRKNGTYHVKGRVLKQSDNVVNGYSQVHVTVDGKQVMKYVHRLVAQTFLANPDNLPEVNHLDCDRTNNHVENLEFCTPKYNSQYREKFGISNTESQGHPVFAINLASLEVARFRSQSEASRELGVKNSNITAVIKGRYKQIRGFWFVKDDGHAVDVVKSKLHDVGGVGLKIK